MMWSMNDALLGVFMRSETQSKLKKIKLASTILRVACKVVLALIVIGFLMATIAILANRGGSVGYFDVWFRIGDLTFGQRALVLAISVVTSAVWFTCIFALHQLFGNFSHGDIFTRRSVHYLRLMGIACVLWGIMKILWVGLSRALSAHPLSSVQVSAEIIPIGIIVLIVAWFMDMAADMQEENELTV
jgi:hypothetical protein